MEALIKFNLPEERNEHDMFMNAGKYHSVIWDLKTHIRNKLKYEDLSEEVVPVYEEIRNKLYELLNGEGISEEF